MKKIPIQYENVLFPRGIGFVCKQCGACCFHEPADLNEEEYKAIVNRGFKNFVEIENDFPKMVKRNKDGSCFFLTKEKKCAIHDIKPATCTTTPFIPTRYNPLTKTITLRAIPESIPGCTGSRKGELSPEQYKTIAQASQKIVQDLLKLTAKRLQLPIDDILVGTLTSSLIEQ